MRLGASAESEVDVYAFSAEEIWLCESKWWDTKKVGVAVIREFLELAEKLKEFKGREAFEGRNPFELRMWLFAHNGVTSEAEALLREHNIYWSTRADLDRLIQEIGLRKLSDFFTS